ncbi:hypothetical protein V1507DRAFT_366725, partial [Lipomyces tetrasporus]
SVKVCSTSRYFRLKAWIYPHHDCTTNFRKLTMAPKHCSTCQDRKTYSWWGYYE